jgi:hypothetical protein
LKEEHVEKSGLRGTFERRMSSVKGMVSGIERGRKGNRDKIKFRERNTWSNEERFSFRKMKGMMC